MWFPTRHDAVEMYAHFLKTRHGTAASQLARKTADALQNEGDLDGCKIWHEVANTVDGQARSTAEVLELS